MTTRTDSNVVAEVLDRERRIIRHDAECDALLGDVLAARAGAGQIAAVLGREFGVRVLCCDS